MTTTLQEILKEFEEQFKNPENTGYRVGQEFLGAVSIFIESSLLKYKEAIIKEVEEMKLDISKLEAELREDDSNDESWIKQVLDDRKSFNFGLDSVINFLKK